MPEDESLVLLENIHAYIEIFKIEVGLRELVTALVIEKTYYASIRH
jgi:hypothetical protein